VRRRPRRIAERLFFDKITTGAQDDLQKVTRLAYALVTTYGMNDQMGNVSYPPTKPGDMVATRPYSEQTAELVDSEVRKLVQAAYDRTLELLTAKKPLAQKLAALLLEKEVIMKDDVISVLGPRPFEELNSYEELTTGEKDAPAAHVGGPEPTPAVAAVGDSAIGRGSF
jgi:AFG3 family protein